MFFCWIWDGLGPWRWRARARSFARGRDLPCVWRQILPRCVFRSPLPTDISECLKKMWGTFARRLLVEQADPMRSTPGVVYKIGLPGCALLGNVVGTSDGVGGANVNSAARKTQEYAAGGISSAGWPRPAGRGDSLAENG